MSVLALSKEAVRLQSIPINPKGQENFGLLTLFLPNLCCVFSSDIATYEFLSRAGMGIGLVYFCLNLFIRYVFYALGLPIFISI